MNSIWKTLSTLFVLQPNRYILGSIAGLLSSTPIVGDAISGIAGHASAKNLQNDAQAHDSHMFGLQSAHAIDMFEREAGYMDKQYGRQRALIKDSPGLQMQGLKSAGLNPILAASGGFKSPAGGALPGARAQASAKGSSSPGLSPVKLAIAENARQGKVASAQASLYEAQKAKVEKETQYVGQKLDITEPIAQMMQALAGLIEQSSLDRKTTQRVWDWLTSELATTTKDLTPEERNKMLKKAKQKFPQLRGVNNRKRKIFGE